MRRVLSVLRHVERAAYPPHMRQMQYVRGVRDLAEYCECRPDQVFVLTGRDWYLLAAEREDEVEIVDFASAGGCREVFRVLATVVKRWRGRTIILDARHCTSYPLVMALTGRYGLRVVQDEVWHWGDESMHSLVLSW